MVCPGMCSVGAKVVPFRSLLLSRRLTIGLNSATSEVNVYYKLVKGMARRAVNNVDE